MSMKILIHSGQSKEFGCRRLVYNWLVWELEDNWPCLLREREREREALEHPCQIISFKNVELNDMILNSLMFYKYKS